ncbi:DNA mismatch repair protein MutL [Halarchaeum rubridurum]|uniref:DNA mismatch repair protein MutL n=1 Tax=Halarchaeum rubridurum TaxID=489911 RepID=A0A830G0I4_9EURY|nr:DNA mismatch repair endonuclease MutL [Halarchaeum rubridurum]MBP1955079.1 DNA mismatch repair protein MutL [Halarchaeum rubridurum]GGM69133.1 DNA mismatch repair protein MutL [Halarchaeum rubridurum]
MSEGEDGDAEIRELDAATIDRIAAGEVVERPASVVKELVENALDADATRIEVEVAGDGTDELVVRDDGVGMTRADAEVAVERHTTSKIRDATDLARVGTLGFRGEALHTIAAVSRLTVTTKPRGGRGTEVRVVGGDVDAVGPAGRAPGTTVAVRDLFYNTPARRAFLNAESTEFGHVNRTVSRYALANPDVAVSLEHDGTETFATPGDGDVRSALLAVYGRDVAASMIAVDAAPDRTLERVEGYVSHPETTRSTRDYLATYVNGRYVSDRLLREAIVEAYGTQLAADRFPFAVLDVELPPSEVDANVHPRKMEVRFEDEPGVRAAVTDAVRDALREHGLVRTSAPRGASKPTDAAITPERDSVERGDTGESGGRGDPSDGGDGGGSAGGTTNGSTEGTTGGPTGEAASGRHASSRGASGSDDGPPSASPSAAERASSGPRGSHTDAGATSSSGRHAGATRNARLPGTADAGTADGTAERERERLPPLRVLGQLHGTYVVAATDDGLVLVDQHAADERVRYEALREELGGSPDSQALVTPAEVSLTAAEAASFEAALPALREAGFEAEVEDRTAVVTAVPAVFGHALDAELVRDVLASATSAAADDDVLDAADALLADMACKPAIKGNTSLPEGDVTALLDRLDGCAEPWACPHGRPVLVEIDAAELDRRFERDYPGHQDRTPE